MWRLIRLKNIYIVNHLTALISLFHNCFLFGKEKLILSPESCSMFYTVAVCNISVYSQSNGLHTGSARLPRRLPEPMGSYSLSEEKCTRAPPLAGTAIHNLQNTITTLFHLLSNYQLFRDNKTQLSLYLWLVCFSLECRSYLKSHHPLFFLNKADSMSNKRQRSRDISYLSFNDSDVIYDNLEAKV